MPIKALKFSKRQKSYFQEALFRDGEKDSIFFHILTKKV
jgi:hypothetical protein